MIYPTIWAVPRGGPELSGKPQVDFLSRYARQAVAHSAEMLGLSIKAFETDDNGAPRPSHGIYWSLSHKPDYVAGVAAGHPIGIDVEKIRTVSNRLFDRVASKNERALMKADPALAFFRCWTAKEVVLKRVGVGVGGLSQCRLRRVIDDCHLAVSYRETVFTVAQNFFNQHVAAVLKTGDETINWQFGRNEG
ncbi:MAG: 4'-phosphopantetheinyl transferase superfamily protein [Desulfobacterales bacterium]|nr:4'-phosphopantetheinyl transferase superfamily protein [Desulfobacterales bacterium]